jgi:cation transport regulator ChaC
MLPPVLAVDDDTTIVHDPNNTWVFAYGSLIWKQNFNFTNSFKGYTLGYKRRFVQGSTDHRGTPGNPGRVVTLVPAADVTDSDDEFIVDESTLSPRAPAAAHHEHRCYGMAFRIDPRDKGAVMAYLDHRERGGYKKVIMRVVCEGKHEEFHAPDSTPDAVGYVHSSDISGLWRDPDQAEFIPVVSAKAPKSTPVPAQASTFVPPGASDVKEEDAPKPKDLVLNCVCWIATPDNPEYLGLPPTTTELAAQIHKSEGESGSNTEYLFRLRDALRNMGEYDGHVEKICHEVKNIDKKSLE